MKPWTKHAFPFARHRRADPSLRDGTAQLSKVARIVLWCVVVILGLPARDVLAKKPLPANYVGSFTVYIRGYWTGAGEATVTAGTVQISATVTDDAGNTGTLVANNLVIVDNTFSGTGTILGKPMTVEGRVDGPDPAPPKKGKGKGKGKGHNDDTVLTEARVGATFSAGGHFGRIAGPRG